MKKRYGKYEVVREIGSGGFGVVYEGRDPSIKRRVAIKTCTSPDATRRRRFAREAEIAGRLQHRNIVTVFDLGVEDDVAYLVQEYLPGEDLGDRIARGAQLSIATRLRYLVEIADGLEYAHSNGVIHRDVKPANIRVLSDDSIKILDFGIAKLSSAETNLTRSGTTMGTMHYLSPEQLRGERVDHRADIFSFGVVAYELIAGLRPFEGESVSSILYQIVNRQPRPLREVCAACPPRLDALVRRCLEKERTRRFARFSEVITELRVIRAELATDAAAMTATLDDDARTAQLRDTLVALENDLRRLVLKGELTAAEIEIDLARKKYGSSLLFERILRPLIDEIGATRERWESERQRTQKLAGLLDRARRARGSGELDEAVLAVEAALELDPASEEARALAAAIGDARDRRCGEEARRLQAEDASRQVETLLDEGELEQAGELLAGAVARFGEVDPLRGVGRRLDRELAGRRNDQIDSLAREAEALSSAGRLEAARDRLEMAVGLDPAREDLQRALQRATVARDEEIRRRRRELALRRESAARGRGAGGADLAQQDRGPGQGAAEGRISPPAAGPPAGEETTIVDLAPQRGLGRRSPSTPPPQPPAPRPVRGPSPAALPPRARGGLAVAACVLVIAGVIWWAGRERPAEAPPEQRETEQEATAPETSLPVVAGSGVLKLDALPWAEVTAIVDSDGRHRDLGGARYTPLYLELPPGEYRVSLRNPQVSAERTLAVTIRSGLAETRTVELEPVDVDDYFARAGW